jgi:hypothetical protein
MKKTIPFKKKRIKRSFDTQVGVPRIQLVWRKE